MPERFAQEALGHNSKAVHRAYAKKATIRIPSLEDYEKKAVADGFQADVTKTAQEAGRKAAKNPLRLNGFPALGHFPGLGLVGGVNVVGRPQKKKPDDFVGRFENVGADHYLHLLRRRTIELLGGEAADELLDLRVLGQD